MRTKVKLAFDLKDAGAPEWMIRKAIDGYYNDYESDLPTPIHQLVHDCEGQDLKFVAENARNGKYDSSLEEAQAWLDKHGKFLVDGKTLVALFGEQHSS